MRRTNIVIDSALVDKAMRLTGARSKREVVDIVLRRLVEKGDLYREIRRLRAAWNGTGTSNLAIRADAAAMMIVDSNTWADCFNGIEKPHVAQLSRALEEEEDLAVIPIVIMEVLQGFRSASSSDGLVMCSSHWPFMRCRIATLELHQWHPLAHQSRGGYSPR